MNKRLAKEEVKRPSWHWLFPQAKASANFPSIQLMNLRLIIIRIHPSLTQGSAEGTPSSLYQATIWLFVLTCHLQQHAQ